MFLVVVLLILALFSWPFCQEVGVEGSSKVIALDCLVLGIRVPWASLVQELLKLLLRSARHLASQRAPESHDCIVWLALSGRTRVILLASILALIVAPLVVVVIAMLPEVFTLLLLLVYPSLHHVT